MHTTHSDKLLFADVRDSADFDAQQSQPDSIDGLFSPSLRRLAEDVLICLRKHPVSWLADNVGYLQGTLSFQDEPGPFATWDDLLIGDDVPPVF